MSVKRYIMDSLRMVEDEVGPWVHYHDHMRAMNELEQMMLAREAPAPKIVYQYMRGGAAGGCFVACDLETYQWAKKLGVAVKIEEAP